MLSVERPRKLRPHRFALSSPLPLPPTTSHKASIPPPPTSASSPPSTPPLRSANPNPNLVAAQVAGPTRPPPSLSLRLPPPHAFLGSPVSSSRGTRGTRVFAMDPRRAPPRSGGANGGGGLSYSTLFNLEVVFACCVLLSPPQHVFLSGSGVGLERDLVG
jgi:hypothetical protein